MGHLALAQTFPFLYIVLVKNLFFFVRPSQPNVLCFYENTTIGCIEQMFTS